VSSMRTDGYFSKRPWSPLFGSGLIFLLKIAPVRIYIYTPIARTRYDDDDDFETFATNEKSIQFARADKVREICAD